ncbi:MAG TPA: hypothetical protein DEA47_04280 [Peptococcaceae bacterium]|nr:hypothetical protein [Peptococcaceae bacterium]
MAFILYRLLLLVKGTKAVQLLKGLALLGAISIISHKLGFATINWSWIKQVLRCWLPSLLFSSQSCGGISENMWKK